MTARPHVPPHTASLAAPRRGSPQRPRPNAHVQMWAPPEAAPSAQAAAGRWSARVNIALGLTDMLKYRIHGGDASAVHEARGGSRAAAAANDIGQTARAAAALEEKGS